MSSAAQILANQANAQKSCGPKSRIGKEVSSENHRIHGLSSTTYSRFFILENEREEEFYALKDNLIREHTPQTETEKLLVRRMVEHEWLRARAVRLQDLSCCVLNNGKIADPKEFALYLRYQSMHERGFYKALNELQKLRNEKRNEQIGFVSQTRAAEALNLKQQQFEMKKQQFELKKNRAAGVPQPENTRKETPQAESSPATFETAA
jgi:hypothetical protein